MNFKRNLFISISVLICFLLQTTVFKYLSFGGISPNLLLLSTAAFGLMYGQKVGLVSGFFSGLLIDMFCGPVMCFYALIYMYIGFCNGFFNRILFKDDVKLPIALISVSDLIYGLVVYLLMFLLRGRFHFSFYFIHIILPEIAYTIVLSVFIYPLYLWIHGKINKEKRGSLSID